MLTYVYGMTLRPSNVRSTHACMHNRHFDYKMHAEWDGAARLVILVRLSGRSGCHRAEGWATAEGPSWRKKDKQEQELKREGLEGRS